MKFEITRSYLEHGISSSVIAHIWMRRYWWSGGWTSYIRTTWWTWCVSSISTIRRRFYVMSWIFCCLFEFFFRLNACWCGWRRGKGCKIDCVHQIQFPYRTSIIWIWISIITIQCSFLKFMLSARTFESIFRFFTWIPNIHTYSRASKCVVDLQKRRLIILYYSM